MADTELHELLKKLDAEIEKTDAIDENGRTLLRDLDRDIRELLDRSESMSDTSHAATISGLEETLSYFEITHPVLADTISKIMAVLSNAGI